MEQLHRNAPNQGIDGVLERGILLDERLDLGDGVKHRGVILAPERPSNFAERRVRELPSQIHGNLTRKGHGPSPVVAPDVRELDAEELGGLRLDVVDGGRSIFLAPEPAEDFVGEAERQLAPAERLEGEQACEGPFDLSDVRLDPARDQLGDLVGQMDLLGGLELVPVVMGLMGVSEVLLVVESPFREVFLKTPWRSLLLTMQEWKDSVGAMLRGAGVGFFLGLIPGMNTVIAAFMAYIVERRVSKTPEKFGTGVIQGVAGPETANNAFANAAMIPLLSLGIPGSPAIAVLLGAFLMNGVTPGPFLFTEKPDLVWAVIASFFVGNVILLILNLPLIGMWVSLLRIPYSVFFPLILVFCIVGSYSINGNVFDIGVMVAFSVLGYVFRKLDLPLAPAVLTYILGPLMEKSLRNSLEMSRGDFGIIFRRPISAVVLAVAACLLIMFMIMQVRGKGQSVREEQAEV